MTHLLLLLVLLSSPCSPRTVKKKSPWFLVETADKEGKDYSMVPDTGAAGMQGVDMMEDGDMFAFNYNMDGREQNHEEKTAVDSSLHAQGLQQDVESQEELAGSKDVKDKIGDKKWKDEKE